MMADVCIVRAPGLRAWLSAAGYDRPVHVCEDAPPDGFDGVVVSGAANVPAGALAWHPTTYREVMARALAVAAAVGCSEGMMQVVADGEIRLSTLRRRIGIDRKAPPADLPACVVRVDLPEGPLMPGLWVPDLVDRAAGHHVLLRAGAPDVPFPAELPRPDIHVVTLPAAVLRPGPHLVDMVASIAAQIHPQVTW